MNTKTFQVSTAQSVITTDVLVLGGGPAGSWAALSAAKQGARVVLGDKGYCGTSGATAPSNTGTWYLPKGAERDAEIERRLSRSSGLADRRWLQRVIEQAQIGLDDLGDNGYPFPFDEQGNPYRANLRGPDYMRFMRQRAGAAGVSILDHHPALELLWADGAIAGAAGIHPRTGNRWEVRAGAVVLATGGCATKVPGLYAAGDAASRENLTGAVSGGGSPNASWAIASGTWSGRAAALFAASLGDKAGTRLVRGLGQAGLRPRKQPLEDELISEAISAVQAETLPLDVNFFRSGARIALSRQRLDAVWADISDYLVGEGRNTLRAREAAAMAATARWIWGSADARKESRGMHRRTDFTKTDVQQTRRIFTSGIDDVVVVAAENQLQEVA